MVNITALEQIYRFVVSNKLKPMKSWSFRFRSSSLNKKSFYLHDLVKKIRFILNILSGGDVVKMLKDVLYRNELKKMAPDQYSSSNLYKSTDNKKRHFLIRPFKLAGFSFNDVRQFGFSVSKNLWSTCLDASNRDLGGRKKGDVRILKPKVKKSKSKLSSQEVNFQQNQQSIQPQLSQSQLSQPQLSQSQLPQLQLPQLLMSQPQMLQSHVSQHHMSQTQLAQPQLSQQQQQEQFTNSNNKESDNSFYEIIRNEPVIQESARSLQTINSQQKQFMSFNNLEKQNNFGANDVLSNVQMESFPVNSQSVKAPDFCRNTKVRNKESCKDCKAPCEWSLEHILHPINPVNQYEVLKELSSHGHPKYRIMASGIARNTNEARLELADHYVHFHNQQKGQFYNN